jgi:hypothetical protein
MTNTQQMLEEALKHFGPDDIVTKMLSIKRDREIAQEQAKIYERYKEKENVRRNKDMSISFN